MVRGALERREASQSISPLTVAGLSQPRRRRRSSTEGRKRDRRADFLHGKGVLSCPPASRGETHNLGPWDCAAGPSPGLSSSAHVSLLPPHPTPLPVSPHSLYVDLSLRLRYEPSRSVGCCRQHSRDERDALPRRHVPVLTLRPPQHNYGLGRS